MEKYLNLFNKKNSLEKKISFESTPATTQLSEKRNKICSIISVGWRVCTSDFTGYVTPKLSYSNEKTLLKL